MSRDDKQDLALISVAALALIGILIVQYCKPLPFHRRVWVQVKAKVGR